MATLLLFLCTALNAVNLHEYDIMDLLEEIGSVHTTVMALMAHDRLECREEGLCPISTPSINFPLSKSRSTGVRTECIGGFAGEYPCNNIDLLSFISLSDLGCEDCDGNDIWGWRDANDPSGITQLYALAGTTKGTSVVRVTDPLNPVVTAWIPSRLNASIIWRDIKVRNNMAYIVADRTAHYMQYFDLTRVRGINTRTTMQQDGYWVFTEGNGKCHNIVIDENSNVDRAYLVGTNGCSGGLYAVDISDPFNASFAGCFSSDGYTHDAQCVTYNGTDAQYVGNEICFAYNEDTLTIVDMTDPMNGVMLSRTEYIGQEYTHQGWLSEDHAFVFLDDEFDERRGTNAGYARTFLFDVRDLANPVLKGFHDSSATSIDHNQYAKDGYVYQSNYEAGLRVLNYDGDVNTGDISVSEVAYFDTYPEGDTVKFRGAWSNYPFFDDFVVVQDINRGLFVVQVTEFTSDSTTNNPTSNPTANPTSNPTANPTSTGNLTPNPTANPTSNPTANPTPQINDAESAEFAAMFELGESIEFHGEGISDMRNETWFMNIASNMDVWKSIAIVIGIFVIFNLTKNWCCVSYVECNNSNDCEIVQ